MPAGLRMNAMANPGVEKADFGTVFSRSFSFERLWYVHRLARRCSGETWRFRASHSNIN